MKKGDTLGDRMQAFAREYLVDLNGKHAAIRAGYSPASAKQRAEALLKHPKVRALVDELKAARSERVEVKADDVLVELRRLAFVDIGEAYSQDGRPLPINLIPKETRLALDFHEETEFGPRLRFRDKLKALELLGKHLKLFTEKVELSGGLERLTDEQLEAKYRAIREKIAGEPKEPAP